VRTAPKIDEPDSLKMKGTYIIAIIVLYFDDKPGPRIERAFRAIHQIRPAERDLRQRNKAGHMART